MAAWMVGKVALIGHTAASFGQLYMDRNVNPQTDTGKTAEENN